MKAPVLGEQSGGHRLEGRHADRPKLGGEDVGFRHAGLARGRDLW